MFLRARAFDSVSPVRFGLVHRGIGRSQKRIELIPMVGKGGNADARGHREIGRIRHLHLLDGNAATLGGSKGLLQVGARKKNHELLAAEAPDDVIGAKRGLNGMRRVPEDAVAERMPMCVVDALEVIEVDHQDGKRSILIFSSRKGSLHHRNRKPARVGAGQRIELRRFVQATLVLPPHADQVIHDDGKRDVDQSRSGRAFCGYLRDVGRRERRLEQREERITPALLAKCMRNIEVSQPTTAIQRNWRRSSTMPRRSAATVMSPLAAV